MGNKSVTDLRATLGLCHLNPQEVMDSIAKIWADGNQSHLH